MTRGQLLALWVFGAFAVVLMATQMACSASYFKHHGVAVEARLTGYEQAGGRQGPKVWGNIEFQAGKRAVDTIVAIGSHANASDTMFSRITAAGQVSVLYDPKRPTSVVFNEDGDAVKRQPRRIFMGFASGGVALLSVIVLPLAAYAGRKSSK